MTTTKIEIFTQNRESYFLNPFEMKLDDDWDRTTLGKKAKKKRIYIFFTQFPERCIYVGKTRGPSMDFATRLYRHATEKASQNGKVYKKLIEISQEEPKKKINVSLLDLDDVRGHFKFESGELSESAMIDILEQVLIHHLHPEIQDS